MHESWLCKEIRRLATSPQVVIDDLVRELLKLRKNLNKLKELFQAFREILPKRLGDISDSELRQRLSTVVAGGIDADPSKSFAWFMHKVFNVGIVVGSTIVEPKEAKKYMEYGLSNITVGIENQVRLENIVNKLINEIDRFMYYLEDSGLISSKYNIHNYNESQINKDYFIKIIKEYVPSPGEKPNKLLELLNDIRKSLVNLSIGFNSTLTLMFILRVIPLATLVRIINGCVKDNERTIATFENILRIIHYYSNVIDLISGKTYTIKSLLEEISKGRVSAKDLMNKEYEVLVNHEVFVSYSRYAYVNTHIKMPHSLIYSLVENGIYFEKIVWDERTSIIKKTFIKFIEENLNRMKELVDKIFEDQELKTKINKVICDRIPEELKPEELIKLMPLIAIGFLDAYLCHCYGHNKINVRYGLMHEAIEHIYARVRLCA